jgi:hypothetical protein
MDQLTADHQTLRPFYRCQAEDEGLGATADIGTFDSCKYLVNRSSVAVKVPQLGRSIPVLILQMPLRA